MNNYDKPGNIIDIVAGADLSSGVPVIVGTLLAIPVTDIATGQSGAAAIEGVFVLPKNSDAVIAAGDKVNWESGAGEVIVAAGGAGDLNAFGVAVEAADAGVDEVKVKLTPGTGTAGA